VEMETLEGETAGGENETLNPGDHEGG